MGKTHFNMVSLGCARSIVDAETMVNRLKNKGFMLVPERTTEQTTILNTCSFIQSAIDETEAHVDELETYIRKYPFQQLGCFAYSHESHTRSGRRTDLVDDETVKARISRIKRQHNMRLFINEINSV